MWLRLRQIALVAEDLDAVERDLTEVLDLRVCHRDPAVSRFGLENILLPVGNELLEVVSPVRDGTAAGRYLTRRAGDGGYMVITQCDDHRPRRKRVQDLGIRIVNQFETRQFRNMQLHPRDTGGSFFEIDQQLGDGADRADGPWEPAGPEWQTERSLTRVTAITAAEMQCDDPAAVAARWSEIIQVPACQEDAHWRIPLDNASLRFAPCADGRAEGLGAIDVASVDPEAVLTAARARDAVSGPRQVHLCGVRINLV